MKYRIVEAMTITGLQGLVNGAIKEGWQLHSGIAACFLGEYNGELCVQYLQAMVKE
jgi:hypothetical protein